VGEIQSILIKTVEILDPPVSATIASKVVLNRNYKVKYKKFGCAPGFG